MKDIKTIIASQLDENQVGFLITMINQVYKESEGNIWKEEHERIGRTELLEILKKKELLLAISGKEICGCIHLESMEEGFAKFKMLVANPVFRGTGVGSILVNYAEKEAKENGAVTMQLELLVPTDFIHRDKEFLRSWYKRIGYQKVIDHDVDYLNEGISKMLKVSCRAEVYHKNL